MNLGKCTPHFLANRQMRRLFPLFPVCKLNMWLQQQSVSLAQRPEKGITASFALSEHNKIHRSTPLKLTSQIRFNFTVTARSLSTETITCCAHSSFYSLFAQKAQVLKYLILRVPKYEKYNQSKLHIYLRVCSTIDYQLGQLSDLILSIFLII